jgi:hypothetical protein
MQQLDFFSWIISLVWIKVKGYGFEVILQRAFGLVDSCSQ